MTCYHPNKNFIVGTNPENGKYKLKFTPYKVIYITIKPDGKYKYYYSPDVCPDALNCDEARKEFCQLDCFPNYIYEENFYKKHAKDEIPIFDFFTVGCGQCRGCMIKKSKEWANRMMLELPYSSSAYFLTLTYDDNHLPVNSMLDRETGELHDVATLDKEELQRFFKRLSKKFGEGIRYYAVGEYGSKTMRPHYHAIIWNLPLTIGNDLVLDPVRNRSQQGYPIYVSKSIEDCWRVSKDEAARTGMEYRSVKGIHALSEVTWNCCAYVARYVMKKRGREHRHEYEDLGLLPEFAIMSRRPGIGRMWYDEHGESVYETDIIKISGSNGPLVFQPPSYYDRLFAEHHSQVLEDVKDARRTKALNATRLKLSETSKTYPEYLATEEYNFSHKIRSLEGRNIE